MKGGLIIDVSSVPPKPAGAGRYAIELVSQLSLVSDEVGLVVKSGDLAFWRKISSRDAVVTAPGNRPLRIAWDRLFLARQLERHRAALYHGIHYTIPHGFRGRRVATIHDMTMIEHPEWHEKIKVAYFSAAIRYAVAHADAIVVPSEFTKTRLKVHFGDLDNVHVIHHGVDREMFRPRAADSVSPDHSATSGSVARERVVLHIGTIEPRKNIENLVRAFDLVAQKDADLRLLLVGQKGWKSEEVYARVRSSRFSDRIGQVGYLSEEELTGTLRNAACVVYPSFAEGFGLPVLEAMAAGVPVVTSAESVMEEVAGGCAWLCNPMDPSEIAARIEEAMSGSEQVISKVTEGIKRSAEFDWGKSAREHLKVYESLGFEVRS